MFYMHKVFLQLYEPPDLGNKFFTTWNVLKPEVCLTCINLWKFHDHLKACVEVIRLAPKLTQKCEVSKQFFWFWPTEKSVFELMTNLKFSFSESGPGVFKFSKN